MVSSKSLSNHFSVLLAQATDAEPLVEEPIVVEEVPPAINIAIANRNRLGPYSLFLKDAFEAGQADQFLQVIDSDGDSNDTPIDILAIGRSLTPGEKAQGFEQQLITREKIAFIVSPENTFDGTLTIQQLSGIFDGSITNWQELGGEDLPIRVVNRSANNDVRRALSDYGSFKSAKWNDGAVKPAADTTADIIAQLGVDGISYAPANETIEQFSTQILTIDNVGVDDGRYPFSLPLYYVYESPISEKVQSFLNFVQTPDAQSAVEFAQSQPADPTRSYTKPLLGELRAEGEAPVIEETPEVESPTPIETASPSPETSPDTSPVSPKLQIELWSWFPLLIVFGILAFLSWLAMMRVRLEKKHQKTVVRPAPNYAQRLKAQGSNRNPEELEAIATKFKEKTDADRAEREALLEERRKQKLEKEQAAQEAEVEEKKTTAPQIDLSLDSPMDESLADTSNSSNSAPQMDFDLSLEDELEPLWDEDQTTLQMAPPPEIAIDEDMTVLQVAPQAGPPQPAIEELVEEPDEDMTVLQGVFDSPEPEPTDSPDDSSEASSQIDPLTGIQQELEAEETAPHADTEEDWSTIKDPWEEQS